MFARPASRAVGRNRWLSASLGTVLMVVLTLAMSLGISSGFDQAGSAGLGLGASTLVICKNGNVTGTFLFSINDANPVAVVAGTCLPETVENGINTVPSFPTRRVGRSSLPSPYRPLMDGTGSVATRTATVNIPANGTATTTFTNIPVSHLVVCKHASDQRGSRRSVAVRHHQRHHGGHRGVGVGIRRWVQQPHPAATRELQGDRDVRRPGLRRLHRRRPDIRSGGLPLARAGSVTVTVGSGATTTVTFTNDTTGSIAGVQSRFGRCRAAGPVAVHHHQRHDRGHRGVGVGPGGQVQQPDPGPGRQLQGDRDVLRPGLRRLHHRRPDVGPGRVPFTRHRLGDRHRGGGVDHDGYLHQRHRWQPGGLQGRLGQAVPPGPVAVHHHQRHDRGRRHHGVGPGRQVQQPDPGPGRQLQDHRDVRHP